MQQKWKRDFLDVQKNENTFTKKYSAWYALFRRGSANARYVLTVRMLNPKRGTVLTVSWTPHSHSRAAVRRYVTCPNKVETILSISSVEPTE
mmetsp:Transcript_10345/g.11882  ORF Transcript_10345/g.11882 Transcript_10345/m.11882 type:complete len:92 (-) Transcript_10345:383-658(-)